MGSPKSEKNAPKLMPNRTVRRYRINPLELVIFTVVTAGFGLSIFQLFRGNDDLHFATLQPMQIDPTRNAPVKDAARAIATVSGVTSVDGVSPVANPIHFEVNCADNPGFHLGSQVCPNEPTTGRQLRDTSKYNPSKIR
jgi:hypothetical protein